ncbi:GAF domain-containing sensor histidine kinase [Streptomyces abyssomicinicus]|uniref:GAF domain-containing sensor histidine kinase n=1 Tax=Streptomyces abyssomicinicus TaxID=574929 RepID=UPI001250840B|nr:GAF domain-containing sensor histidine kinase [Streptomyces abyssomicinicus]
MNEGTTRSPAGLAAVSDALLAMSRRLEVGDVLKTIVSRARELLGARYAALGVPDDCGGFARFVVDGVDERTWKAIGPLPRQHGILAAMLHEGPQRLDDVRADPRFEGWPAAHPEMTDFLGMPIRDGDEILGALYLANKERTHEAATEGETTAGGATEGQSTDQEGAGPVGAGPRAPAAEPDACGFTEEDEELLSLFAQHAAIALTNARLYERSRELTIAEERSRLAHELHDAVSQKLFSLRLTAQAAATLIDRAPARAKEAMGEVAALAAEATDELRAAVIELRPAALDEDGLVATLRSQIQVLDRAHTARVSFTSHDVRALPAAQEAALLRVAQEALHNALRHGDPRNVEVVLERRGPKAVLRVGDDGRGFAPEAVLTAGRHLGLVSMRDRATGVGGTLTVRSAPGEGAVVEMEVPGG